jgi:ABC-type polysaccharide/polyol phosphate export permease
MYPISIVPKRFRSVIDANPLMYLLQIVRDPVYNGRVPSLHYIGIACAAAALSFLVGWAVFRRLSRGFYPYL